MANRVKLYAISTCGWCKKTKNFLDENHVEYEFEDVDLLEGEEKERAREEVARHNPRKSYPTIVIDDDDEDAIVIVGFDADKLKEALGL
jgi:glutaredoxin-like protein NrdH